jgi:hypothetical protein
VNRLTFSPRKRKDCREGVSSRVSYRTPEGERSVPDNHTFLTSKLYQGLEKCMFVGTINRRLEKPDGSFRPVYLGKETGIAGQVTKAWSSFTKGFFFGDEFSRKDTLTGMENRRLDHKS